jgi:hypothetical protein
MVVEANTMPWPTWAYQLLPVAKDPLKLQPKNSSAPCIDVERSDLVSFSSRKEKLRKKLPSQQTPRCRRHGLTKSYPLLQQNTPIALFVAAERSDLERFSSSRAKLQEKLPTPQNPRRR